MTSKEVTNYAESETMSTSGIEDSNSRLRELDGSWEERYAKLRCLAIKLKAKIKEQEGQISTLQQEKENIISKSQETKSKEAKSPKSQDISIKDVQRLQKEIDMFQDKLDASEAEKKQYLARLNTVAETITKDKETLAANEETISNLKQEIESLKTEKIATDNWKKQIGIKVQALRKENEANTLLKKEFEDQIKKLKQDLLDKDAELKKEQENHKETKNLLDQNTNESRNYSVLNLEMKDYERSTKELSKKIESLKSTIEELKNQLEIEKSRTKTLESQNKELESERVEEEKQKIANFSDFESCKKENFALKEIISQKEDIISDITNLLESTKSENEDLSVELSNLMTEHQKIQNCLQSERDEWRNQSLGLQQNLREVQNILKLKEDTLKNIEKEYENYKVRAHMVLKDTQTRDLGLEEKLSEDLQITKTQYSKILAEFNELKTKHAVLETTNEILTKEKEERTKKCDNLECEVEDLRRQVNNLMEEHQKAVAEHTETVRSLKVHTETLSQCYRQQILEQEAHHNKEVVELQQALLEKQQDSTPHEPHVVLPAGVTREEAEGSESIDSFNGNKNGNNVIRPVPLERLLDSSQDDEITYLKRQTMEQYSRYNNNVIRPVPLERLLDSSQDDEITYLKRQTMEQYSRLEHLTSLLSDTEKDLEKHVQMNKVLKEEIRRQQRSVEREKHAENLEYLKNVLFKFVTLNSSDEKIRLVPVLNTILKLSPQEVKILDSAARGHQDQKGWSNYIPGWSGSKPK